MGDPPAPKQLALPFLIDDSRRCFTYRWPRLLSEDSSTMYFEQLRNSTIAPWRLLERSDGASKRSTCWYVRGNCTCSYTYGSDRVEMGARDRDGPFAELMEKLTKDVFSLARPDWSEEDFPNSANLNLYENGKEVVGWHADDESLFGGKDNDCLIVSLSLGASRRFLLSPRGVSEDETLQPDSDHIFEIDLSHGDLMTMEGLAQKHYLHCVPSDKTLRPRVNVTWRWIRNHRRSCPLHVPHSTQDETDSIQDEAHSTQDED